MRFFASSLENCCLYWCFLLALQKIYKGVKSGLIIKMAKMKKNHFFNYRSYNDKSESLILLGDEKCKYLQFGLFKCVFWHGGADLGPNFVFEFFYVFYFLQIVILANYLEIRIKFNNWNYI